MAFLRKVAACVAPSVAADIEAFRAALLAVPSVPPRLQEVGACENKFGNDWVALTGRAQVESQLVEAGDCRVRTADGASKSLSITAYSSAVVKLLLQGLEKQLEAVSATASQRQAVVRGVAVHLNGVWMGGRMSCRVLVSEDGLRLKYSLDPDTRAKQYMGQNDDRSARRKAMSKPAGKSHRAYSYF